MANSVQIRQLMGCGYEKPVDHPHDVWQPFGMRGAPLKFCPGYTTKLPEVSETSWARFYLEKGALAQFTDRPITEQTREAIEVLAIACADEQAHELEHLRSKGGAR